ncbi:MAG: hypothetical protein ACHQET_13955 [Chitinophagales bacterium]
MKRKPEISPDIPVPDRTPEIWPDSEPEKTVIPKEPEIFPETEPDEPSPNEIPEPKKEGSRKMIN